MYFSKSSCNFKILSCWTSTKTEKSLDKNLAPRRDNRGQGSKIIQDLDVYLLNFGLKFKNVAKTLINSEISNLPQSPKGITNLTIPDMF